MKTFVAIPTTLVLLLSTAAACAVQYPALDPGYTQEIYTGPLQGGPGMAWTPVTNHLLSRNGSDILEYSPTQNTVYQGTNLHGTIATHTISGLVSNGAGMTNGLDGYIYAQSSSGLQRFNPSNWAAPAQSLAGTAGGLYGITTLPDGRIAYTDSGGASNVYVYNPTSGINTLIYTASTLIDGIVAGPTGNIALAGQGNSSITIITSSGTLVNTFSTPHYPDGMAFGENAANSTLYSNNNDGTISKYVLGPGYSGTPVITDIASGAGAYGDLASVGPDCAFYVTQFWQPINGYHGSTPNTGTHWDNGVSNLEASIIRIGSAARPDGTPAECEFYSAFAHPVPLPAAVWTGLALLGGLGLSRLRRRATV